MKTFIFLVTVLASQSALAGGFFVCTDVRGRIISGNIGGEVSITNAKVQNVSDGPNSRPVLLEQHESQSMVEGKVLISLVQPGEEERQAYEIRATRLNGTSDATIEDFLGDTPSVVTRGSCVVKFSAAR